MKGPEYKASIWSAGAAVLVAAVLQPACALGPGETFGALADHEYEIVRPVVETRFGTAPDPPVDGFSAAEQRRQGSTFRWSLGRVSRLDLELGVTRPKSIDFDVRCLGNIGKPRQQMSVAIGSEPVGRLTVGPAFSSHRVEIPPSAWRQAEPVLTVEYSWTVRPCDVNADSKDLRELAVAWRSIRMEVDDPSREEPSFVAADLRLPRGRAIDVFVSPATPATLVIDEIRSPAGRPAELEITFRPIGGPAVPVIRLSVEGSEAELRRPLPTSEGAQVARLRLVAHGADLVLVRPGLVQPASTEPQPVAGWDAPLLPRRPPRDIVFWLVDTLRADHLGCYGYDGDTSPHLDALVSESILFEHAVAPTSWTRSSAASLLTGLEPHRHTTQGQMDALPEAIVTLAEVLARAGFRTFGLTSNTNVSPGAGFDQGFEVYRSKVEPAGARATHYRSDRVAADALEWIDHELAEDERAFLYLHTADPHGPYSPPLEILDERGFSGHSNRIDIDALVDKTALPAGIVDLYDAEIAWADRSFGALLDGLRQRGRFEDALVLFVADHGEEFLDHGGFGHAHTLYQEQRHVPLVRRPPGGIPGGLRVAGTVSLIDVVPTVLEALGLEEIPSTDGRPLRRRSMAPAVAILDRGPLIQSIQRDGWKLVRTWRWPRTPNAIASEELFHLLDDPDETHSVLASRPIWRTVLREELERRLSAPPVAERRQIDQTPEEIARLKALGYL